MNGFAQLLALVSAIAYIGASPLELVFFDRPWARRFLQVERPTPPRHRPRHALTPSPQPAARRDEGTTGVRRQSG